MSDFYAVLGVPPDASDEDIKRAFRGLARRYHPDATGGDPEAAERYKEISEAYAVLSDPVKRRQYDGARVGGFGSFGIEDLFESFFGGGQRRTRTRTRARQGESIEVPVELEFREAVFGTSRTLSFQRMEPCPRCESTGCEPGSHPVRCDRCDGTGQLQQVRRTVFGQMMTSYPCGACGETGWRVLHPCRSCGGAGRAPHNVDIPIEVPPGIEEGDRLRLRGEGEIGIAGGGRGDLYVRFVVRPDERFERSGDDLVTWVEIPMTTAALGGDVHFESLDGTERLQVPRGTQSGTLFRVRNRGAVRRGGRARGDLHVRAHVLTPTDLGSEQEQLVRKLAELRGESGDHGKGIIATLRRALGQSS